MNKAQILRKALASKPILRVVGAHNALGAKLIERNRFDGVWASGLEISTAHAVPDANILTMTEVLHAASSMNEATALPILCDCDTGYGNASNVNHLVKKYEASGIAAIVIEDKLFPKQNSFVPGRQELASIEEFKGKIEAAKNAQRGADFMVFARVEALIAGWGMEEALRRARAYCEAGADGIVIHSKATTPDEIFAFSRQWKSPVPLVAIPTTYYEVTAEELAKKGFKIVIYANQGLRASIQAMDETFKSIHESGSTAVVEPRIAPMKTVFEIQGMLELKQNEEKFSPKAGVQAIIPAAADHRLQAGFGEILKDLPLCMLEIGGKTLIDRQADALRSFGIREIFVVGGYSAEKIKAEGAKILRNTRYAETGSAYSVMLAKDLMRNECLIAYSDILFNRLIVDQLLKSPYAITLVIDRAYQTLPYRDKKLDLVIAEDPAKGTSFRRFDLNNFRQVRRVGTRIDKKEANYEFIGMALFKNDGIKELRRAWEEANQKFSHQSFYESPDAEKADFNDLLQFLIDRDVPIHGLEIEHGWSEIHSPDDLRRARAHFEPNSTLVVSKP